VVIHLEYSELTLCDLSYVDNMYTYTGKVLEAGWHMCMQIENVSFDISEPCFVSVFKQDT